MTSIPFFAGGHVPYDRDRAGTMGTWKPIPQQDKGRRRRSTMTDGLHWAFDYALLLTDRSPRKRELTIQTSMSPSGYFHIGNFRDTASAYLVHRALKILGRPSRILLSFDDYDPFRDGAACLQAGGSDMDGFPQGAARRRTTTICERYIDELAHMGLAPPRTTVGNRPVHEQSPDDTAAWQGPEWIIHSQYARYRGGSYESIIRNCIRGARVLARLLGRGGPAALFGVYCRQCGRNRTRILELSEASVVYQCLHCHSLDRVAPVSDLKPCWRLDWTLRCVHEGIDCEPAGADHCSAGSTMESTRTVFRRFFKVPQPVIVPYGIVRQPGAQRKISGSGGGGLTVGDLLTCYPPPMILWMYARRPPGQEMVVDLSRASVFAEYNRFDRWLTALPGSPKDLALYGLITDLPPPAAGRGASGWPSFRQVVATLAAHFYDRQSALKALERDCPNLPAPLDLATRLDKALGWISCYGRNHAWIRPDIPRIGGIGSDEIDTDRIAAMDTAGLRTRTEFGLFYLMLFGVKSGPPVRRVLDHFGKDQVRDALQAYRRTGSRPLRDVILGRLNPGDGAPWTSR